MGNDKYYFSNPNIIVQFSLKVVSEAIDSINKNKAINWDNIHPGAIKDLARNNEIFKE